VRKKQTADGIVCVRFTTAKNKNIFSEKLGIFLKKKSFTFE
jgi:hypothetical protein